MGHPSESWDRCDHRDSHGCPEGQAHRDFQEDRVWGTPNDTKCELDMESIQIQKSYSCQWLPNLKDLLIADAPPGVKPDGDGSAQSQASVGKGSGQAARAAEPSWQPAERVEGKAAPSRFERQPGIDPVGRQPVSCRGPIDDRGRRDGREDG
jgi:hypothetical protein